MSMALNNPHIVNSMNVAPMMLDADGLASGQAFLTGALEKMDPTIGEPLTSVTWQRDIYAETGGGYVEFTSNFFVEYATSGANEYGIIGVDSNVIPTIQSNLSKDIFPVQTFANIIRVPFLSAEKLRQMGKSLEDLLQNGLNLNYNKALDANTYTGFTSLGQTGLVNNPNVTSELAPFNAANTSRTWADKTPQEILNDFNQGLMRTWAQSEYDLDGMANHVLLPPDVYADLGMRIISSAGNISVLEYLKKYNIAVQQGRNVEIVPCRQVIDAGVANATGGDSDTGRAVFYVNDKRFVCMDLPVPLTRLPMTQADVNQLAFLTPYIGLIGQVKFKYTQTAYYQDGVS